MTSILAQFWGDLVPNDTSKRVLKYWGEFYPSKENIETFFKVFKCDNDELVLIKDIPYQSLCEHHLLPFFGVAHISYIPQGKVLGLSKFGRIVDYYAKRPQIQERLTKEIGDIINSKLSPLGVIVILEGTHTCMSARGVLKQGATTKTSYISGVFKTDFNARQEVLNLLK